MRSWGLALLSAVVTEVWMLFVIRILIGVAIGADIAASISFLAELSPKGSRGGWTGAMPQIAWSLGAMCAVLVDAGLYAAMGRGSVAAGVRGGSAAGGRGPGVASFVAGLAEVAAGAGAGRGRRPWRSSSSGLRVVDRSRLPTMPASPIIAAGGARSRVRGWFEPYARLFSGARRPAVVFAILMIGLIPLNGIGQSVLGPYVLHQFGQVKQGRVDPGFGGYLDRRAGRVVSGMAHA